MNKTLVILATMICGFLIAKDNSENESLLASDPMITIHAESTYLPTVLAILADESGFNIVTGPLVDKEAKLTIHLDNIPVSQAINLIVRAVGLSYEIIGNREMCLKLFRRYLRFCDFLVN